MNKILVGTTEIEVVKLTPYAYSSGKGEKVLQIKVLAENAIFEQLRALLENTEESIKYYEEDTLVCEYVGYGVFEAQYKDGTYNVELHKTSVDEQMSALLVANEKLNVANETLQKTAESLTEQNALLVEQNTLLDATLAETLESIIPSTIEELMLIIMEHEERLLTVENILTSEESETTENEEAVTDETVSE